MKERKTYKEYLELTNIPEKFTTAYEVKDKLCDFYNNDNEFEALCELVHNVHIENEFASVSEICDNIIREFSNGKTLYEILGMDHFDLIYYKLY